MSRPRAVAEELPGRETDYDLPAAQAGSPAPGWARVDMEPGGPVIVPGPVQIVVPGAEPVVVGRFRVALCACGRSGRYPLCDSSHRLLNRTQQ